MQKSFKISKSKIFAFCAFLVYVTAIALGAVLYLPYQAYAPGIFKEYSVDEMKLIFLPLIAFFCVAALPEKIERPSDWFLIIFIIFLFLPGLTLGVASDELDIQKKIILLPTMIASMLLMVIFGKIQINNQNRKISNHIGKGIFRIASIGWVLLLLALLIKYSDVMRFADAATLYEQRELTGDVGGLWGYIQLYFSFVCSTLLVAYGLSSEKWRWFIVGSAGYFVMYLITAEKSQLMFPLFFVAINHLVKKNSSQIKILSITVLAFALIIVGVVFLSEEVIFFDLAGFYLFTRLIAIPGQFILDYYDFFSTHGYTFFSQIRGVDLLVNPPEVYASNEKWPQLGWVVGSGYHHIESNSNATFMAADGAASMGALGMILMTLILCFYLIIVNNLSKKFPKLFWSIIFAQQAFILVSGSLFSMLLSFGGLFYLLLFFLKNKNASVCEGVK